MDTITLFRETAAVLRAARAKIENPDAWTRGAFARNQDGLLRDAQDSDACAWCAMGAVRAVSSGRGDQVRDHALRMLHCAAVQLDDSGIASFNDTRTHADVLKMFNLAIQLGEAA